MDKELYDKVLILMSIDTAFEDLYGYKYVDQSIFDHLLKKSGVSKMDDKYVELRLEEIMDDMQAELMEGETMNKVKKYRVYMMHVWGGNPRKLGLYDSREEAMRKSESVEDSMFASWVEEEWVVE